MDPANSVSLNMVCKTRLYQSIGNHQERVGFRHVLTPLCMVIITVCFARSGEIIQRAAKVWGSMGAILLRVALTDMSVKATLNAQDLNMRCQDIIKVLVISDVSLISGQGGKRVSHQ